MSEIRVNSWTDLQEKLFENYWNPEVSRYRAPWAYRGHSNTNYKLTTSLIRLGGNYVKVESHLLKNFKRYSGEKSTKMDCVWHWLIIARHYGLPTRVLDWSYSP